MNTTTGSLSHTVTLLVGPAASGKTSTAIQMLRNMRRGKALLVVRGMVQQEAIRPQLPASLPISLHSLHRFAWLVVRRIGLSPTRVGGTLRTMLLRAVIRHLVADNRLPHFAAVAHKPGVIATIGDLVAEAQDACVVPRALANAAVTPYDADVGSIYEAYDAALTRLNLADTPRALALACAALQHNPALLSDIELLIIDGFDQFTPLQVRLLAAAAPCVKHCAITLTWTPDERPALCRFTRTYAHLVEQLCPTVQEIGNKTARKSTRPSDTATTTWKQHDFLSTDQPPETTRSTVLSHLAAHIFDLDAPPPIDAGGALATIAAADREREARAVLRRVRHLLHQGTPPENMVILVRSSGIYEPLLCEVAHEYGLTLTISAGYPLVQTPLVIALLALLRLPLLVYPRRVVAEVWRCFGDGRLQTPDASLPSPALFEQCAALLDQVSSETSETTSILSLRSKLEACAQPRTDTPADEAFPPLVQPDAAAHLLALIETFCAWLKPPQRATIPDYVQWVKERIVIAPLEPETPPTPTTAHYRLAHVLEELSTAAATLSEPAVDYGAFVNDLSLALAAARYGKGTRGPGAVHVLTALEARGVHVDHVFLMGMSQGEFPLSLPSPTLYSRRERALLAQRGLPLHPPEPADERSLFYETIALARRSLTLSRTYLDESGNPLLPSPYLTALLRLVTPESVPHERVVAGSVPSVGMAASPQEVLVALFSTQEGTKEAQEHQPDIPPNPTFVAHVRHALAVEQWREGMDAYGDYEGMLYDETTVQTVAHHFGPLHRWSVTQLNNYTTCPFLFAAAHVLNLEPRMETEEGLDRAGRGRISHDILAKAGREDWAPSRRTFTPDQEDAIVAALNRACDDVFAEAPSRYGFTPGAFWEWEQMDIRLRLVRAIRRIIHESRAEWSAFAPMVLEWGFGLRGGTPALQLAIADGTVLVAGRVDRIDEMNGGVLAVLDYKSSSSTRPLSETTSGYDVQLPIYVLAVETLLRPGQAVERAAFLHLGSGKHSAPLTTRHREEAMQAMRQRVAEAVAGVRGGCFPVRPYEGACPDWCHFAGICRVHTAKAIKKTASR